MENILAQFKIFKSVNLKAIDITLNYRYNAHFRTLHQTFKLSRIESIPDVP